MGLIEHIIKDLGLKLATTCETPAEHGALGSDKDAESGELMFSYNSVIGMLGYLDNTSPAKIFRSSQEFPLRCSKKDWLLYALKKGKRLHFETLKLLKIDCYVDADFVRI